MLLSLYSTSYTQGSLVVGATSSAAAAKLDVRGTTTSTDLFFPGSLGSKISLYENRLGLATMHGFGVESGTVYYMTSTNHRWYLNTAADGTSWKMNLDGSHLQLVGPTLRVGGSTTGHTRVSQGDASYPGFISFYAPDGVRRGFIGYSDGLGYLLINTESDYTGYKFNTTPYVGTAKIWHANNDGATSGLDSDLLDGQHGSYYLDITNLTGTLPAGRFPALSGDVSNTAGNTTIRVNNLYVQNTPDADAYPDYIGGRITTSTTGSTNYPTAGAAGVGLLVSRHTSPVSMSSSFHLWSLLGADNNLYFRKIVSDTWTSWWKVWHEGNDGAGTGLDADLLDARQLSTIASCGRAPLVMTGGGNITVSADSDLKWSSRLIVISTGTGVFATSGYFQIDMPAVDVVISGVGGATDQTVTAGGIRMLDWNALYYILPIGGSATSLPGNFRLVSYGSSAVEVPENWLLIAIRNSDLNLIRFSTGFYLRPGQALAMGTYTSADLFYAYLPLTGGTLTGTLALKVNDTATAPLRFSSVNTGLLSVAVAGSLESNIHTSSNTRGRLYFTDGVPARHELAYSDDLGFTNDVGAQPAGGLWIGVGANYITVDAASIPSGSSTWWWRFRYDKDIPNDAVNFRYLCAIARTGSNAGLTVAQLPSGIISLTLAGDAGATYNTPTLTGALDRWDKQIIDLVCVRATTGIWSFYVNGVSVALGSTTGALSPTTPIGGGTAIVVGNSNATFASVQSTYYRFAVFNRALTATEVAALGKQGVASPDQWGSNTALYTSNFATTDSWSAYQCALLANQTIGEQATTLRVAGGDVVSSQAIAFHAGLPRGKRVRVASNYYIPTANTVLKRLYIKTYNTTAMAAMMPVPAGDTWTSFVWEPTAIDNYAVGSNGNWETTMASAAGLTTATFPSTDYFYLHSLIVHQIGAIVDLNFSIGSGTIIPDRSGRYPGTVTGSGYLHIAPGQYLPLTGGTLTGALTVSAGALTVNSSSLRVGVGAGYVMLTPGTTTPGAENPGYISFYTADNLRRGYIGWNDGTGRLRIVNENGATWSFSSQPYVGSQKIWYEGNDGAGSTLDSDTVDGVQAASFALLSGATFTGTITLSNTDPRIIFIETDGATDTKRMDFVHQSGGFVGRFYNDAGSSSDSWLNVTHSGVTPTEVLLSANSLTGLKFRHIGGSNHTVWHAGNLNPADYQPLVTNLAANKGGTGNIVYVVGDILYASTTTALSRRAIGSTGQVLKVVGGVPAWADESSGGGGVTTLAGLTDTTISAPANGEFLKFNGTVWVNALHGLTAASVGAAATVHTHVISDTTGLQAAIDLKLNLTGGTISGALALGGTVTMTALGADLSSGAGYKVLMRADSGSALRAITLAGLKGFLDYNHTDITGVVTVVKGGTGFSSYVAGNMLYADSTTTFAKVAPGTHGQVLKYLSGVPTWAAESAGGSTTLGALTDVTITTPAAGQFLKYVTTSGGIWINSAHGLTYTDVSAVGVAGTQDVTGVKTFTANLSATAGISLKVAGAGSTAYLAVWTSDPTSSTVALQNRSLNNLKSDLGLNNAAYAIIGSGSGQVAAGDHTHSTYLLKAGGTMTGALYFNMSTDQMINLHGGNATYGIGIQSSSVYVRTVTAGRFAIYAGGSHVASGPGGGTTIFEINEAANTATVFGNTIWHSGNYTPGGGGSGGATTLGGLTDVTLGTPAVGHFLRFNGTVWANAAALIYSDVGAAPFIHNHLASEITGGTLAVARGGTGKSAYAVGDLLIADGTSSLGVIAKSATVGHVLKILTGGSVGWGTASGSVAAANLVLGDGLLFSAGNGTGRIIGDTATIGFNVPAVDGAYVLVRSGGAYSWRRLVGDGIDIA